MRRARLLPLLAAAVLLGAEPRPAAADDAPKIRAVTPGSALRGSTVDVAIEGTNLFPFTDVTCSRPEVSLVPQSGADSHKVVVRMTIPDTTPGGPLTLTIKTKTGVVQTQRFAVRLRSPTLARIKPDTVARGGAYDVVVTGTNLAFLGQDTKATVDAPVTVAVGPKPTDKALTLHLTVPPETPPGPRTLTLETTDGKISTTFVVAMAPPTVTGADPATVARGTDVDLTVKGQNLAGVLPVLLAVPDASVTIAPRGAATATAVPLRLSVRPDAAPGPRLLVVRTADGLATARIEVTTPTPRILSVKPAGAARGASADLDVAVEGAPGGYTLRFVPEDPAVTLVTAKGARPRVTVAPEALPGPRTLVLEHPFGLATAVFTVNLKGPGVTGVAPSEVAPGAEADLQLEGQNLDGASVTLAADDPGVAVTPGAKPGVVHVAVRPDARPGPRALLVRTADGASIGTFAVQGAAAGAPVVSSVSPVRAVRGQATELTISGLQLRAAGDRPPEVSVVGAGPALAATVAASTPSSLRVKVDAPAGAALGGYAVVVRTPDGVAAAAFSLVPGTAAVTGVDPAQVSRPGEVTVVLTGTGLVAPGGLAPSVTVARADGSGAVPARVAEARPERLAVALTLEKDTPTGDYVLRLTTSEGGLGVPLAVAPAAPAVEAMQPDMMGIPASVTFRLTGRNLLGPGGAPPKVVVTRLGSASGLDPQVLAATATELTVRVITEKGTPVGPYVLVVKTADGPSAAVFTIVDAPMPVIDALDPTEGLRSASVVVKVRGAGLSAATAVAFEGTGVTGAILPGATDRELAVRVAVAPDAAPGARAFTVTSPGGVASSGKVTFLVR